MFRELWTERDPRVPIHRQIDAEGRPTVEDVAEEIRAHPPTRTGLLAVERRLSGEVIGYCGLVVQEVNGLDAPELAFEFLRRAWGHGYATEASSAVLNWARSSAFSHLWATVWDWNTASRRVLEKLGFAEIRRETRGPAEIILARLDL